jgi:hypothetical protein
MPPVFPILPPVLAKTPKDVITSQNVFNVPNGYSPFYEVDLFTVTSTTKVEDEDGNPVDPKQKPVRSVTTTDTSITKHRGGKDIRYDLNTDFNYRNWVTSVEISGVSSQGYKAVVILEPPYQAAVELIDQGVITWNSIMRLQWGYRDNDGEIIVESDRYFFTITEPSLSLGLTTQITLSGQDLLSKNLTARTSPRVFYRGESFFPDDMTIALTLIAEIPEMEVVIDERFLPKTSKLYEQRTIPLVQSKDNLKTLKQLLRDNDTSYTFLGSRVVLFDEKTVGATPARFRMLWYTRPTQPFDIPIESITTNSIETLFQPAGIRGGKFSSVDTDDASEPQPAKLETADDFDIEKVGGTATVASPDAGSAATVDTGDKQVAGVQPIDKEKEAGATYTGPQDLPSGRGREEAITAREVRFGNNRAQVTALGHPSVVPMMNVDLVGLPKKLGGIFRIRTVTHRLGAGYTMDLDLIRTASSAKEESASLADTGGQANDKPVDSDATTKEVGAEKSTEVESPSETTEK